MHVSYYRPTKNAMREHWDAIATFVIVFVASQIYFYRKRRK